MLGPKPSATPPWLKRLGGRIRQARRVRGFTQSAAAGPHLTKSFISLLESGRTYPSVATLVALTDRLQSSLALLLLDEAQLPRETALTLLALARGWGAADPTNARVDPLLTAVDVLAEHADGLRIETLLTRGDLALRHGEPKAAERWFNDALNEARERHERSYEPRALMRIAALALQRNDRPTARRRLDEALPLFRATRTLRSVDGCQAMILHGRLLIVEGKQGRALRVLEEVVDTAGRHDLPLLQGQALQWVGQIQRDSGRLERALETLRRAKDALIHAGEGLDLAQVLHRLGTLSRDGGDLEEAQTHFQHALRIQQRIGASAERSVTLNDLAQLEMSRGRLTSAHQAATDAYELASTLRDCIQQGRVLVTLARIAKAYHRWKAAAAHLREAVEQFKKAKHPDALADAARELGMLLKERGEHAEAADYLAIALSAERETH